MVNEELNKVLLGQKILSECCELMKLCDINCSCPVFLRHTVVSSLLYTIHFLSQSSLSLKLIFIMLCIYREID